MSNISNDNWAEYLFGILGLITIGLGALYLVRLLLRSRRPRPGAELGSTHLLIIRGLGVAGSATIRVQTIYPGSDLRSGMVLVPRRLVVPPSCAHFVISNVIIGGKAQMAGEVPAVLFSPEAESPSILMDAIVMGQEFEVQVINPGPPQDFTAAIVGTLHVPHSSPETRSYVR